ncbi:glycosyltransferase [Rathayibacter sp. VKM Ac-2835]|uniref:glycosyltransferase n=1 Tax=Rathayibacter sp. VKM Ac-2835 TaxID=2739043 RepID=UPI00156664BC|nr:glycosyltransferase [Rathayibacter sp. VKM Ac-2835]NRG41076.1 glycosyltransferase [Rathayibacter sp. VKM Ac-2835]
MTTVVIPSLEPDHRLLELIQSLREEEVRVVVVDDGSGPRFAHVFAESAAAGATVLAHPRNLGKGAALRTAFAHLIATGSRDDVVCADSDGQHRPHDVLAVAAACCASSADIVLGGRSFTAGTPLRSRIGNAAATGIVGGLTGLAVHDTQTGLRAYPARMLPWLLGTPADGFDYEMELLLRASRDRLHVLEVPIETVYLEHNARSHFRPLVDSWRVARPLVAFASSSLLAFALDTVALLTLVALGLPLIASLIAARLLSASINFALNRRVVFAAGRQKPLGRQLFAYAALALVLLIGGSLLLSASTVAGVPLVIAKPLTDVMLAVVSFGVQRAVVFTRTSHPSSSSTEEEAGVPREVATPRATSEV